jgi:hypothetical protein
VKRLALALAAILAGGSCGGAPPPRSLDAGRLGTVRVFEPQGAPVGLVFLFSDAAGPTPALDAAAGRIAAD